MHDVTAATQAIAAEAARLIVDEGLSYGAAKSRAATTLGARRARSLPNNDVIEAEVRAYIALFCADTQPAELAALRALALVWMQRLQEFRPHLSGAVWNGTATRRSDIYLQLFCDDAKSVELTLINNGVHYDTGTVPGFRGTPVDVLVFSSRSDALGEAIGIQLAVYDYDDLRGALKPVINGQPQRGDLKALARRIEQESTA